MVGRVLNNINLFSICMVRFHSLSIFGQQKSIIFSTNASVRPLRLLSSLFFAFRNSFHIQFCYFAACPLSNDGGILILSPRSFRVPSKLSGCPIMSLYHFWNSLIPASLRKSLLIFSTRDAHMSYMVLLYAKIVDRSSKLTRSDQKTIPHLPRFTSNR